MANPAAGAECRIRKAQAKKRHVTKRMDKLKVLRGGGGKGRKRGGVRGVRGVGVWVEWVDNSGVGAGGW